MVGYGNVVDMANRAGMNYKISRLRGGLGA